MSEFESIKDRIESARQDLAEKKAERKILMDQLQKEFKVTSMMKAKDKLVALEKDLEKKELRKEKLIDEIEDLLNAYEEE